ncbi:hypothetical protein Tco_1368976 [Tanacetum coccineum]
MSQHNPETKKGTAKKLVEVEKSKVLEKTTKVEIVKEKRTVKPSINFYDTRVKISEPLFEEEMKLVEYTWSDSCPEGDIIFAKKGDVLNHEEKYRANHSITSHVYYWTEMLPPHLVEDKNQVNERRRIFDENVAIILENSKKNNFNHVDFLSFFPCMKDSNHHYIICFDMKNAEIDIIDNINNDVEDISVRYGAYAMALVRFKQLYL